MTKIGGPIPGGLILTHTHSRCAHIALFLGLGLETNKKRHLFGGFKPTVWLIPTLDSSSCARQASNTASQTKSQSRSRCPGATVDFARREPKRATARPWFGRSFAVWRFGQADRSRFGPFPQTPPNTSFDEHAALAGPNNGPPTVLPCSTREAHLATGQNPLPTVNIPITTKID